MDVRLIEKTPSAYAYPLLIKNLLASALRYSPKQEIVYRAEQRHTYLRFGERVAQLANALGDLGVKAGDTVAVMDWNSHRYLECYFAVPMIGAILHAINIGLSANQLAYTINHAEVDVIILHHDFLPLFEKIQIELENTNKIILIADGQAVDACDVDIAGEYEELLTEKSSDYIFPDFDENAVATMFYTMGKTGRPKGIRFSHRQVVLHTYGLISALCAFRSYPWVDSAVVYMPLAPMFHAHACGMPYLFTLLGTKQVYPGRVVPESILGLIDAGKVTVSHCVPDNIHMLLNDPAIETADLTGWNVVISESTVPKGLCREALDRGINLFSAYGKPETGPLLTIDRVKPHMLARNEEKQIDMRYGTGSPAPLVDLEIIGPEGKPLIHDGQHTGEIVARSPWLTQSYFKEPEKSESLWQDGWLHTGDVGGIDEEGCLCITGHIEPGIEQSNQIARK